MKSHWALLCSAPQDSNTGYHVAAVADRLAKFGNTVDVRFAEVKSSSTRAHELVDVAGLDSNIRLPLRAAVLWGPREPARSIWQKLDAEVRIVHWEDNELLLASRWARSESARTQELSEILKATSGADVITYLNPNVLDLLTGIAPCASVRLRPSFDGQVLARRTRSENFVKTFDYVVYAGNVTEFVGDGLVRASIALRHNEIVKRDILLLVTGADYTNLMSQCDNVVVGNFLSKPALNFVMKSAKACIQPSGMPEFERFRFASKLPEYYAYEIPIVAEPIFFGFSMLADQDYFEVKSRDVEGWVSAFNACFSASPPHLADMGRRVAQKAAVELSWDDSVLELHQCVDSIVAGGAAAQSQSRAPESYLSGGQP